jgi:hypothetical protein
MGTQSKRCDALNRKRWVCGWVGGWGEGGGGGLAGIAGCPFMAWAACMAAWALEFDGTTPVPPPPPPSDSGPRPMPSRLLPMLCFPLVPAAAGPPPKREQLNFPEQEYAADHELVAALALKDERQMKEYLRICFAGPHHKANTPRGAAPAGAERPASRPAEGRGALGGKKKKKKKKKKRGVSLPGSEKGSLNGLTPATAAEKGPKGTPATVGGTKRKGPPPSAAPPAAKAPGPEVAIEAAGGEAPPAKKARGRPPNLAKQPQHAEQGGAAAGTSAAPPAAPPAVEPPVGLEGARAAAIPQRGRGRGRGRGGRGRGLGRGPTPPPAAAARKTPVAGPLPASVVRLVQQQREEAEAEAAAIMGGMFSGIWGAVDAEGAEDSGAPNASLGSRDDAADANAAGKGRKRKQSHPLPAGELIAPQQQPRLPQQAKRARNAAAAAAAPPPEPEAPQRRQKRAEAVEEAAQQAQEVQLASPLTLPGDLDDTIRIVFGDLGPEGVVAVQQYLVRQRARSLR